MAKVNLDRAYLIPYPNGLREVKGPGEVDESELPEEFVKRLNSRQKNQKQDKRGTPLPGDFPGYRALAHAGYTTVEEVSKLSREELVEVDGIGETTADTITQAAHGEQTVERQREVTRTGEDATAEKARQQAQEQQDGKGSQQKGKDSQKGEG